MAQKKKTVSKTSSAKNSGSGAKTAAAIGVGVTAAMLTAAGAYFLYGSKDAAKNRRQVRSWALKAKAEVLEGLEKSKDVTQENYDKLVDTAVAGYGKVKKATGPELDSLRKELKSHWKELQKKGIVGKTSVSAPKTAKAAGKKKK